jgi:prophage tail gpP-like protein
VAQHQIDIEVGGKSLPRWQNYRIVSDLLAPADDFDLQLAPYSPALRRLVPLDAEIAVKIDGTKILTGYIEEREPSVSRGLQTLQSLAVAVVGPWFDEIVFSNSDNRSKLRGKRGRKAPAYGEPEVLFDRSKAPKKVEPGQKRWDVLADWLEPSKLLAWSTADGKSLVIGLPNYDQETQYSFRLPAKSSGGQGNIISATLLESIAERFSEITVVGASRGDSSNYGRRVTQHRGVAANGDGLNGIGFEFERRKTLIISDDEVKSAADAFDRASREMALRDASRENLRIVVKGHGQRYNPGSPSTLFACDTMAEVAIAPIEVSGRYLIVSCEFSADKQSGEQTALTLVPENTILTQ